MTDRKRQAYCGRFVSGHDQGDAPGVTVKVTAPGTDQAAAGFSGLQTCGSVWSCPVCSEKVNAHRQGEIERALESWLEDGNSLLFGTLTLAHAMDDRLADLWGAVSPSWAKTVGGPSWHGTARQMGDKQRFNVAGWLRVVEVKDGVNGWHPHIHVIFFIRGKSLTKQQVKDMRHRLFGRWNSALADRGYHSLEGIGVDLRRVGDAKALGHYFAKNVYGGSTDVSAAAYEVTGSQSKRQGKGGVTPFQLLERIVVGDERAERTEEGLVDRLTGELFPPQLEAAHRRDLARWREWEEASAGRRQLTWSKGLRDMLDLEDEVADEDLAAESALEGQDELTITPEQWKAGGWAYKRETLLEWAERGTLHASWGDWLLEAYRSGLFDARARSVRTPLGRSPSTSRRRRRTVHTG